MKKRTPLTSTVVLVLLLSGIVMLAVSAFLFTMLDQVVRDLYSYGLQFNQEWAVQYWNYSGLILGFFAIALVATDLSIVSVLVGKRTRRAHSTEYVSYALLMIGILTICFSVFFFVRLDYVVYHDLYSYGLQFSYEWAGPYWKYAGFMFNVLGAAVATNLISIGLIYDNSRQVLLLQGQGEPVEKTPVSLQPTLTRDVSVDPFKEIASAKAELEELRRKVWSYRRLPTRLAGHVVTFAGVSLLLGSMVFSSTVGAIIGLVLTFWGILFFFLKPTSLVKADLLDSSSLPFLENVHKLISEFGLKGKGVYLPPRSLKELRSGLVYISTGEAICAPTMEDVKEAEGRIFSKNPGGVCLVASGVALTNLFERELGTSFAEVDLEYLERNLPKVLIEDLEIAEDFAMSVAGEKVHVRIEGSIYKDLCNEIGKLSRVCEIFGCPLCSSIACSLTRASGKPVVIERSELSRDGKVMDVYYRVLEE